MRINKLWGDIARLWNDRRADDVPAKSAAGRILIRAGGRTVDIQKARTVRGTVLIREQNVPGAAELDKADEEALHLLAIDTVTNTPVGVARVLDNGDGTARVDGVAVLREYREIGIEEALMGAIFKTSRELEFRSLVIFAQAAVVPFYEAGGFEAKDDVLDNTGTAYRRMVCIL